MPVKQYINKEGVVVKLDASHLPLSHMANLKDYAGAKKPDVLTKPKKGKK